MLSTVLLMHIHLDSWSIFLQWRKPYRTGALLRGRIGGVEVDLREFPTCNLVRIINMMSRGITSMSTWDKKLKTMKGLKHSMCNKYIREFKNTDRNLSIINIVQNLSIDYRREHWYLIIHTFIPLINRGVDEWLNGYVAGLMDW